RGHPPPGMPRGFVRSARPAPDTRRNLGAAPPQSKVLTLVVIGVTMAACAQQQQQQQEVIVPEPVFDKHGNPI
ncbi:MAG: hypothetical protein AAF280_05750, partial [Pseudomonadota bacterium]